MHLKRTMAVALVALASIGLGACRTGNKSASKDAEAVETSTGLPYRTSGKVDTVPVPQDYRLFPTPPGRSAE